MGRDRAAYMKEYRKRKKEEPKENPHAACDRRIAELEALVRRLEAKTVEELF